MGTSCDVLVYYYLAVFCFDHIEHRFDKWYVIYSFYFIVYNVNLSLYLQYNVSSLALLHSVACLAVK